MQASKISVSAHNARVSALREITEWADEFLRIAEITDYPNALNGLQLENAGRITKIACVVDCSTRALQAAAGLKANLLIVHHGMFWSGVRPIAGALRRQLKCAFEHEIAVYSAHLPLDLHPEVGNNVLLLRALGIESSEPFFAERGAFLGRAATVNLPVAELVEKLRAALPGEVKAFLHGDEKVRRLGLITGGAGSEIERVAREGIDTFITGEAPHWAAVTAEEVGVNLLLGGHYATETFGVKALAAKLAERFGLEWAFIDLPTGL